MSTEIKDSLKTETGEVAAAAPSPSVDAPSDAAFEGATASFEGPEKLLEVWFQPEGELKELKTFKGKIGLRRIEREQWQEMLDLVRCEILSVKSNDFLDAYLLSESSLFVYPHRILLKTCGTTTLLKSLNKLLEIARSVGLTEVEDVFYSRKNFMFPGCQVFPHTSFADEVVILDELFDGSAYILGKVNGDHWYLYLTDKSPSVSSTVVPDQTLEIIMTDLAPEAMRPFFKTEEFTSAKQVTEVSGIADLIPGSIIDDFQFEPCGYSMNGMLDEAYFTIHITPQENCSYASFETNVTAEDYTELVEKVLKVFRPKNFTVTLFANLHTAPSVSSVFPAEYGVAKRSAKMMYEFENNYKLFFNHYTAPDAKVNKDQENPLLPPRPILTPPTGPFNPHDEDLSDAVRDLTATAGGVSPSSKLKAKPPPPESLALDDSAPSAVVCTCGAAASAPARAKLPKAAANDSDDDDSLPSRSLMKKD